MNVYLFENNEVITFSLPAKKIGDFWLKDSEGNNMVNISGVQGNWILSPSKTTIISDAAGNTENIVLKVKNYYMVLYGENKYLMYCDYSNDSTYKNFRVKDGTTLIVGSSYNANLVVTISSFLPEHLKLVYQNNRWTVYPLNGATCYINNKKVKSECFICNNGDLINIYGIKILLIHESIFVNDPFEIVRTNGLELIHYVVDDELVDEEIEDKAYYDDEDYFLKSPRVRKHVTTFELKIDSPPAKENIQEVPLWVTMAPMLTMVASSSITLSNALIAYINNEKTFAQILPTLVISGCMIFTMLIWPNISRKMQKKQKIKKEEERQHKYGEYVAKKDRLLLEEYETQKRIIEDNVLSTDICYDMIINRRRTLWSRRSDQDDFLNVRVGIGDEPFNASISYTAEDFTMESDELKSLVQRLVNNYKMIENVPMSYSFKKNVLTGINGLYPKYVTFTNNLLLQLMAFHSYDDLKFVIFTNEYKKDRWEYLINTPYCFSNDKTIRFYAVNSEEMQDVSNYLEQVLAARQIDSSNNKVINGYYIILIDDIDVARKIPIVSNILKNHLSNFGFSLVILEEKLSKLPSEVTNLLVVGEKTSVILDMTVNEQRKFLEETKDVYNMKECAKILSNLPIYMESTARQLPNTITFLETFSVGKIEQLNVLNRWKQNNPTKSLKAEIGVNVNGDSFVLDLHEKAHGPHGLVAGMTGSGKSEFIITYVLSMAVNYSPEEVQFVLIDYKGGGLASAFVDSDTGRKIPHIAGTITNLDKSEINRALASINSELRRRQAVFNQVKMDTGEGTVDIYKYQRLYRDGVIKEPMSHLIIVCDEFAELKSQQPDFMNDLVSAARIGRSLGVHLILATQKPSGVVDAQIWSNAKFKICLKVQDKQDSNEMIRNDLAAEIKQVGRFYLLVGYSEFFSMGQSAWAGAQYYPSSEFKKSVDKNLYVIDNVAAITRTINNAKDKKNVVSQGEELTNIVDYLIEVGEQMPSLQLRQLWLDRIPNLIYVDDLKNKYGYKPEKFIINPILGEYDNPAIQVQNLLTVNFNDQGNTIIYGMNESGKDEALQTLIYSMIDNYSSDELNMYLIDFGAETLINFKGAPQIGDIVLNGDEEKLKNLAKTLYFEMSSRKKEFTAYGGNYADYIKYSGKTLPNIVVVINAIDVMTELYLDFVEKYIPIIREGSKYGIYFLLTAETQSSVKLKIVQSCKNYICLQLSNEQVYRDILGRTNGMTPMSVLGRGLVKIENVCEFQTAMIAKDGTFYDFIKKFIQDLETRGYEKVPEIYVMPEVVELKPMMKEYHGLNSVPIGIVKDNLNVMTYDFSKKVATIIASNEFDSMKSFIKNLVNVFANSNNKFITTIVDANKVYDNFDFKMTYVNKKYDEFVDTITTANDSIQKILVENDMDYKKISSVPNNLIVILGFEKFYTKLDDDHKKAFQKILSDNKEEPKISFIFLDLPGELKKHEYEEWYKNNIDNANGIWIGPGLGQQFVIKVTSSSSALSAIGKDYCAISKAGNATIVKYLNEIK